MSCNICPHDSAHCSDAVWMTGVGTYTNCREMSQDLNQNRRMTHLNGYSSADAACTAAVTVSLDWPTRMMRRSSSMEAMSVSIAWMGTCHSRRAREIPQFHLPLLQSGGTWSSRCSSPLEVSIKAWQHYRIILPTTKPGAHMTCKADLTETLAEIAF